MQPTVRALSAPSNLAERAVLDPFYSQAVEAVRQAVDAIRARGHVLPRVSYRGGILRPAGLEAQVALVVTIHADPTCERLSFEEQRLSAAMRDQLIHAGLTVGGVYCGDAQVCVRGPALPAERAAA